jgi:hypothetical protein
MFLRWNLCLHKNFTKHEMWASLSGARVGNLAWTEFMLSLGGYLSLGHVWPFVKILCHFFYPIPLITQTWALSVVFPRLYISLY